MPFRAQGNLTGTGGGASEQDDPARRDLRRDSSGGASTRLGQHPRVPGAGALRARHAVRVVAAETGGD
eukprot:5685004-Alexandrium_andersonii.AAC.2